MQPFSFAHRGLSVALVAMIVLTISAPNACAADRWVKVTSPHFELFTLSGEKRGREAILYFEQVRTFFMQAIPSGKVPEFPVRIIAFRSENQYKPYQINDAAFAYYTSSESRDYIVMQNITAESYPAAIHEYVHLILRHTGLKLPLWLNEGWADLYSTLKPLGKRAMIGDLIPGRVQTLFTAKVDLPMLISVRQDSPMYNERNKAGIFYAESWALTHMLYLSKDYGRGFSKFAIALASGKPEQTAFMEVFGKSVQPVQKDLQQYLTTQRLFGAVFDIVLEKSAEEPAVAEISAFDSEMLLADLLAVAGKRERATLAYKRLAENNNNNPEIEESLGYLAWIANDRNGARQHFGRALELETKNAKMCYQYAMLQREAGVDAKGGCFYA